MQSDRELTRRKGMRLQHYDYAQPGLYFITVCTHQRQALFGHVHAGLVEKNSAGNMVQEAWKALPSRFPDVELDAFVLMPNHIHGLLFLTRTQEGRTQEGRTQEGRTQEGRTQGSPLRPSQTGHHPNGTDTGAIGRIMQAFKSLTTYTYTQGVKRGEWLPFDGRIWQRNYYDHIIRDAQSLDNIRNYIDANPSKWEQDEENPLHHVP